MTRGIGTVALLLLLLPPAAHAGNPQWVQIKSPNFTVITDDGEKRGRDVALHFEQMRAVFGTLFAKAKIASSQPLYIIAFRSTKEFRKVCPMWNGKPVELAGYFQPGNGVTYIALDLDSENKWETIFHEYGHFLLNSNAIPAPPWFDEGFAEYYSTVKVDGKNFVFGNIPVGDSEILERYKWLPIEELFSVQHDSAAYNERNRQTIFYAESWLAMSHLWFNSGKQKQVAELLELQSGGMPIQQAIQKAFGMDAKSLHKELERFYRTGRIAIFKGPMPPGMDSVAMTATAMDEVSAQIRVAELKLQMKDHRAEAVQEFEEIIKTRPDDAVALRGLAYAALQSGDRQRAADYFRRAATMQSDDPQIYYFSAVLASQLDAQHNPDLLAEMRKNLERAVQLDPNFADAYGWLALAHAWQGDEEEAIAPAEKAVQLSPRNEQWAMNLAGFYANAKRFDDALALCQRLTHSTDPAIAQQASSMFEGLGRFKAQMAERDEWERKRAEAESAGAQQSASSGGAQQGPFPALRRRESGSTQMMGDDQVLTYFVGTLTQSVCAGKQVVLQVASGVNALTLIAPNVQQVSFSGTKSFSCGMRGTKVKGFYSKKPDMNQLVALEFEADRTGK